MSCKSTDATVKASMAHVTRIGAVIVSVSVFLALTACQPSPSATGSETATESAPPVRTEPVLQPYAAKLVEGARKQLITPAKYDGRYQKIPYPNGDVKADRGVCTDVVIRAFRHAGLDLQKAVQDDNRAKKYPFILAADPNIDHRRCPNLSTYFSRHGQTLANDSDWQPGDVVFWKLAFGKDHVGVVSDGVAASGRLMVIHNIGPTVSEQDCLASWKVVGHYRASPVD